MKREKKSRALMITPEQWLGVYTAAVQAVGGDAEGDDEEAVAEAVDEIASLIADNAAHSLEERFGKAEEDEED